MHPALFSPFAGAFTRAPHVLRLPVIAPRHGVDGPPDLALDMRFVMYGGALVILISFVGLAIIWTTPRSESRTSGRPLPRWIQRAADAGATRFCLRAIGLLLLGTTVAVATLGPQDPLRNPAPTWFYVWFWVGLALLSAVFGPFWRVVNPIRTLAAFAARLAPRSRPLPDRLGYWPAAIGLGAFLWIELVYDNGSAPEAVPAFIIGYVTVHTVLGATFGQQWFERADGFEVYSTLLGHMSPIGRRQDGRWVVRNPLVSLAGVPRRRGLTVFIAVLLGGAAFDGLSRTDRWTEFVTRHAESPSAEGLLGTCGLLGAILLVVVSFRAAIRSMPVGGSGEGMEQHLAPSLLPIVLGYTLAHYFSSVIFQGQAGYLLATDPLGLGVDLLGMAGASIDYTVVGPATIAAVQVGSIIAGHLLGVITFHDQALVALPNKDRRRSQLPLLAVMVAYTIGGIALIAG